jgi:hypothetical protein
VELTITVNERKMTRKHFEKIAELIKNNSRLANVRNNPMHVIEKGVFMNELCEFLKSENPNFDSRKFREATGEIVMRA